jgi:acetolactate synthase-1/2/3 large subunit
MSRKPRIGAKALLESLERAQAEVIFGYPGGNIVDVFNLLPFTKFKFVLARHEQGAVHMADGYARATGRVGVALVTSGPGAANTISALATANMDGVPLVLISGQVPLSQIGTDAFQEADMSGICRAATKHSFLVKSADEIPQTVAEAFYIAMHGKPGAVVIDLPLNVQQELTSADYPERICLRAYHPEFAAPQRSIWESPKVRGQRRQSVL